MSPEKDISGDCSLSSGQDTTELTTPLSAGLKLAPDEDEDDINERGTWSSQIEYLLGMIGFSVGLGNVWRFPYICSRNGGGAFLIPFLLCLVLCGLPLFFLEIAIGQFSGRGPIHVWSLCPLIKGVGVGMIVVVGWFPVYYTLICAWSLYYTVFSCTAVLPWTSCDNIWNTDNCVTSVKHLHPDNDSSVTTESPVTSLQLNSSFTTNHLSRWNTTLTAAEEFWQYKSLNITSGLGDFGPIRWELALCLLASWVLTFLGVIKGVKSVGKAVYVTATFPYIILIILLVRGLTLPGGPSGALYYITPDFSKLLDAQVWPEACVQVFYSLGVAWGCAVTMSSYNRFHANCLRNTLIITFVSEGTSLFAGLVVFSILGFMAEEADVPITDVVSSGPGLGFVIYPEAVAQLPAPQLWSFIFFLMLLLLAMDSLFANVETALSAVWDRFPFLLRWRIPITGVYCLISYLLGLLLTTQGGIYVFQLIDWYFVAMFPFVAGLLECVVIAWVYGIRRFSDDIEMMIGRQAPLFFKITWCYITPVMLMIAFIFSLSQYKPPSYGEYMYPGYASTIGWCIAAVPMLPIILIPIQAIYKGKGTFMERVRRSLVPDNNWGPSKVPYRAAYQEKYINSSVTYKDTCSASIACT